MILRAYRGALARPGVRALLILGLVARAPATAVPVTLTLHVLLDLDAGFAAAGLTIAGFVGGSALGAPMFGRMVDRHGLRSTLAVAISLAALFWCVAPLLRLPALLVAVLLGGLVNVPIFSLIRTAIAALVPAADRRPVYALDTISGELSYMVGPALAVVMVTMVSARSTMFAVGAGIVLSTAALIALNPPTRSGDESIAATDTASLRSWMTRSLLAVLGTSVAGTAVMAGVEVSMVAVLRESSQVEWTGVALVVFCAASVLGGLVFGASAGSLAPSTLLVLLSVCTIPIGLAGDRWWLLCLALVPAGGLCAPAFAATTEAVSRLAPPAARSEVMGLHASTIGVGLALGPPVAGAVIDIAGPPWGFVGVGLLGLLAAAARLPVGRRRPVEPAADLGATAACRDRPLS